MTTLKKHVTSLLCALGLALAGCAEAPRRPEPAPQRADVLATIERVNDYWQRRTPPEETAFWNVAAYHTGNIEAYRVTGLERYRRYSEAWAEHNHWMGARSADRTSWKYVYGETDDHVLFGDWQVCFQVYADLYQLDPDPRKIARAREVMEYQMSTPQKDYWWWVDGLYMAMPVMTRLYKITGDRQYLDKLHEYFSYADAIMYDPVENLYYRDARYVYPQHKSVNGKKDFWARGDGWAFAALARVLSDLPPDDPHRGVYLARFQAMAAALLPLQQADGYWTRSLIDAAHAPGPETSGTAFFTYGLLWGVNQGLLPRERYLPAAQRGWHYLTTIALQPDGKLGYVQPIGDRAIPGQVVDQNSTSHFGVGAFLLAGAEMARLLDK
ncbi:glycoside hydrolase family 88 protein [Pelomonas cellulosilytica]|uniref:Glycoside hydrolase family 88 protein n=1 Tax=Pelomonas cellulosilytica TaxID=2906762 RepID=A0ABS8XSX7_9BURK|nr:glycoside hydrolase family 88 protein [Pelomonas sp. P8]MCE4553936.1 glycoside hydrolase family 88 protein [Pelomonas sp. P8]